MGGSERLQVISSLSTHSTATSSGILIFVCLQASVICCARASSQAIMAIGLGSDFNHLLNADGLYNQKSVTRISSCSKLYTSKPRAFKYSSKPSRRSLDHTISRKP